MSEAAAEAILRTQDVQIDTAAAESDGATLEALLADDYIYTHSTGEHQTKREYIEGRAHAAGSSRRVLSEIEVEIHGDVAVTRGNLDIVPAAGGPSRFMRYVRVHRLKDGVWRAISHRTCPATDRAPQAADGRRIGPP